MDGSKSCREDRFLVLNEIPKLVVRTVPIPIDGVSDSLLDFGVELPVLKVPELNPELNLLVLFPPLSILNRPLSGILTSFSNGLLRISSSPKSSHVYIPPGSSMEWPRKSK